MVGQFVLKAFLQWHEQLFYAQVSLDLAFFVFCEQHFLIDCKLSFKNMADTDMYYLLICIFYFNVMPATQKASGMWTTVFNGKACSVLGRAFWNQDKDISSLFPYWPLIHNTLQNTRWRTRVRSSNFHRPFCQWCNRHADPPLIERSGSTSF